MRLLISLTFCLSVLINAMAQNTLNMAMVCMVNSTTTGKNNTENNTESNCEGSEEALQDYQVNIL